MPSTPIPRELLARDYHPLLFSKAEKGEERRRGINIPYDDCEVIEVAQHRTYL
jgi:hypothetical protein